MAHPPYIDAPSDKVRGTISDIVAQSKGNAYEMRHAIPHALNLLGRTDGTGKGERELQALPLKDRLELARTLKTQMDYIKEHGSNLGEGATNYGEARKDYEKLQQSLFSDKEKADPKTFGQIVAAQHNLSPNASNDGQQYNHERSYSPSHVESAQLRDVSTTRNL